MPSVIRKALLPVAASLLLLTPSGTAVAANPATMTLDQAAEDPGEIYGFQWSVWSAFYPGLAQTFTVGQSGSLKAIDLYMNREEFTTQDLVIEIRTGAPDGPPIALSDPVPAAAIPVAPQAGWVHIGFSLPRYLSAGETVAITTPMNDPYWTDEDPRWGWAWSGEDYAGGVAWGGSWCGDGDQYACWGDWWDGSDLAFRTYMGPTKVTGFTGTWTASDYDGSRLTLKIGVGESPRVIWRDAYSTYCAEQGSRTTRFIGSGHGVYEGTGLWLELTHTGCGRVATGGWYGIGLHWDPGSDTLWEDEDGDGIGLNWSRVR